MGTIFRARAEHSSQRNCAQRKPFGSDPCHVYCLLNPRPEGLTRGSRWSQRKPFGSEARQCTVISPETRRVDAAMALERDDRTDWPCRPFTPSPLHPCIPISGKAAPYSSPWRAIAALVDCVVGRVWLVDRRHRRRARLPATGSRSESRKANRVAPRLVASGLSRGHYRPAQHIGEDLHPGRRMQQSAPAGNQRWSHQVGPQMRCSITAKR